MEEVFDHRKIETKWQEIWERTEVFRWRNDPSKEKMYVMEMFPYTSGKMHIGHVRNYTMGDIIARMNRALGKDVLYPMGWDAFGLPAENAAIVKGIHPRKFTDEAILAMKKAMRSLGLSYDWTHEVNTSSPEYIRAQQILFIRMFKQGLIFRDTSFVQWCDRCATVLANEQAQGGICWRCKNPVIKKRVAQWFFTIRRYAERLLRDLDTLEGWPESVKNIQRNWIGRSEGAEIIFEIENEKESLAVFTTRPDTLFGATFVVLAPEHKMLDQLHMEEPYFSDVSEYRKSALLKSVEDRTSQEREKTGVFTGRYAINPVNNQRIPIWVADYVLMDYGTGAIMAVPAHDQRDFEFALKYNIPIKIVILGEGMDKNSCLDKAFTGNGIMINSGMFDGMSNLEAMSAIVSYLEKQKKGKKMVQYRLQNWSISRQRYWGCPIPIIWCEQCGSVPVPEDQLPVLLPEKVEFGKGGSPLETNQEFMNTVCPRCKGQARRDPDTMDTFVDSSWYFLRYPSPHYTEPIDTELVNKILPVDYYIGGVEHAVLHLMYARFFVKVLKDMGLVNFDEPFKRLFNHGMVNDKFGRKQSKSLGNVVEPRDVIERYGADALRVYLMFTTAYNVAINWNDDGPKDALAWLNRVWRLQEKIQVPLQEYPAGSEDGEWICPSEVEVKLRATTHQTIKKVTEDVMTLSFNTGIASLMTLANEIYAYPEGAHKMPVASAYRILIRLLSPFAPHIAEEIWERIGDGVLLAQKPWPKYDPVSALTSTKEVAVQVNGKFVVSVIVPISANEEEILKIACDHQKIASRIEGKRILKVFHVRGKLVNILVG